MTEKRNLYSTQVEIELNSIFVKLMQLYPEQKIFALDSLCPHLKDRLINISEKIGVSYNKILEDYGYIEISNQEAACTKFQVVYQPGFEPDFLILRISNTINTISKYYPSKTINDSFEKRHKRLYDSVVGLALWLGYQTPEKFLNAYGFLYKESIKMDLTVDRAQALLNELNIKYQNNVEKPSNISQLIKYNPNIKDEMKIIKKMSKEWFGEELITLLKKREILLDENAVKKNLPQKIFFKKSSKTTVVTLEEFYEYTNYLDDYCDSIWKKDREPDYNRGYYKFTSNLVMYIYYGCTMTYYGTVPKPKLEEIVIAFRDGKKEYDLIANRLVELKERKISPKKSTVNDEEIQRLSYVSKNINQIFPKFSQRFERNCGEMSCKNFIHLDATYKSNTDIAKNYVVLDLETNGLRSNDDDLLSITIYDPSEGKFYNRLLPLEMQATVLTTYINGIEDTDLIDMFPLCQKEFDELIEEFDLCKKSILFYSGSNFDFTFLNNYCKRKKIKGMEKLEFKNIKKIITHNLRFEGNLSKDNLCNALGIGGVSPIHSGINDCILEWKLFERFMFDKLFIKGNCIYKFNDGYIVPITLLINNPSLFKFFNIPQHKISHNSTLIFEYHFPKKLITRVKKFPTNITGISIENLINSMVNAQECDNRKFLMNNNSKLELIGNIPSVYVDIPIQKNKDGNLISLNPLYSEKINEVNEVTAIIKEEIFEVAEFIKNVLFEGGSIRTQEISFSDDNKIMAICDLSNDNTILEIKTFDIFDSSKTDTVLQQLYYQKGNKNLFVMSIVFDEKISSKGEKKLQDLIFKIYKVEIDKV